MRAHVVRQGEHLSGLAARYGVDAQEIWDAPDNEELRQLRTDGHVLAPGDVLYIPDGAATPTSLQVGATNRFSANVARVTVQATLTHDGVQALGGTRYERRGSAGAVVDEGTADDDGRVQLEVPAHVRHVDLHFPDIGTSTRLSVGTLDPLPQSTGIVGRLTDLGYYLPHSALWLAGHSLHSATSSEEEEARIADSLRSFQRDQGLEVSGIADEATRAALREAHGA